MLLIYLQAITSRTEYVFDLVFKNELGIGYMTTADVKIFEEYAHAKLNYSSTRINEEIFIKASTLLFEKLIEEKNITVERKHEMPVLFPNDSLCDIGFDIFSAVFYMVTRYEEYLPFTPDKHGRFKAADSLASGNNFLQNPVVNIWIQYFKKRLSEKFGSLQFGTSSFKAIVTYDIDIAYAFRGRGFVRCAGAIGKDIFKLKFKNIFNRLGTFFTNKDPWNVYDHLKDTIAKNKLNSVFFFLLGDYSRYDKNIVYNHSLMTDLIKKISDFSDIGIHPSYKSSLIPEKILIEKSRLEKMSNKKITKSRQHYLRFFLPETYNQLLKAGIKEDYSMGFTDMPGFRAGICTPFYFYDLQNERATGLKILPVTFMEGTFIEYMKTPPSQALEHIFQLIENVKNVNGTFISIWHNNTVSDYGMYKGWKDVHDKMIKMISEIN